MTKFTVVIATANIRDVDGCDSEAAVDSIMAAVERHAQEWADRREDVVVVNEYLPRHDRMGHTVIVNHDQWGLTATEDLIDTSEACDELAEELDRVIDMAIEAGDWEDAA